MGGTAVHLEQNGVPVTRCFFPIQPQYPQARDMLANGDIDLVINVPSKDKIDVKDELVNCYMVRRAGLPRPARHGHRGGQDADPRDSGREADGHPVVPGLVGTSEVSSGISIGNAKILLSNFCLSIQIWEISKTSRMLNF